MSSIERHDLINNPNGIITTFASSIPIDRRVSLTIVVAVILLLGLRTFVRAGDWSSDYNLAVHNIAASSEDFQSENEVATYYFNRGNYSEARVYAQQSVSAFPYATNYNVLGTTQTQLGNYNAAHEALENGLKYAKLCAIYDNLSILTAYYGSSNANQQALIGAIRHCSQDSIPWLFLAIKDYEDHDLGGARQAVTESYRYYNSSVPLPVPVIYDRIMSDQPLDLTT
jgi:tetratricopeptide (TPR) repeat protein